MDPNIKNLRNKGLKVAIGLLFVISLINLGLILFFHVNISIDDDLGAPTLATEPFVSFSDLPIERMIEQASLIALTEYEVEDGRVYSVIAEILKKNPGTEFYYQIGDRLPGPRNLRPNELVPDGEVSFFTGSPAQFRYSSSHDNGQWRELGDIPLEALRAKIQKTTH